MKSYLLLQFRMLNRHMQEAGLQPWVGYPLFAIAFAGLSEYLFYKTSYAPYFYLLFALSIVSGKSEKSRNEFLKACFPTALYSRIRWVENVLISLPFIIFLAWKQEWIPIILLAALSSMLVITTRQIQMNFTIPTPFSKHPFEFAIGFRKTFYLQLFAYFLTAMAISVGNFNLGVFSMALLFLIFFSFYIEPENDFYVWIHKKRTAGFLLDKIKRALIQSSLFTLPVLLTLLVFMEGDWRTLLLFQGMGYIFLTAIILVKYASYPEKMYLPYIVLLGMSIYFPPLLLGLIPFLFFKSNQHLKEILG
jgi:hypothetical protein